MTSSQSTAEVAALLDAYLISLDDEILDAGWAKGLFTDDAVIEFPNARHQGADGLPAFHQKSLDAFARHQHLGSPAVVALEGEDRATLRANVIATHVHHLPATAPEGTPAPRFAAGTFVNGAARRTPEGWRLSSLSFRVVWTEGNPPGAN
ncbi:MULTISPECIES: nuclear transport factor 2 family protein [Actinomycetes]|uniref:nuclear transport factor 2 family protein n=1 Tax=Actinomycetes TaxID=1760 RepID=UPI00364A28F6